MKTLCHSHLYKNRCSKGNFAVFHRVMLVALLSVVAQPILAETTKSIGRFFVSETKLVTFAPGNLQCHNTNIKSERTWYFASEQYEIIGTDNVNGGSVIKIPYASGDYGYENTTAKEQQLGDKTDLFYWSETKDHAYGVSYTSYENDVTGSFVDWGNLIIGGDAANTWSTLTYDEWCYLIYDRTNASNLYGVAKIIDARVVGGKNGVDDTGYGVNGVILLPEKWVCPQGITFKPGVSPGNGMTWYDDHQTFTLDQWKKMEAAGAVFLPAAGFRSTWKMYNVQHSCGYWSSSSYSNTQASHFGFNSAEVYVKRDNGRHYGRAVRLAHDTLPILVDPNTTKVTSTAGQTITKAVRITISDLVTINAANHITTITGTSDNPAFQVVELRNVSHGEQYLIVKYTPTATSDGIETATITLTSSTLQGRTSFTMTGRHLPENFAVISKVGNQWYALPSDDANGPAVLVTVDDNADPTQVTLDPDNISWSMKQPKSNTNDDRFILTNSDLNCLNTSADGTLQINTRYNPYSPPTQPEFEWLPASADLKDYKLTNIGNQKTLSLSEQKTFGTSNPYLSDVVRFVSINDVKLSDLRVVEWYPTKVLLYTKDSQSMNSTTIDVNNNLQSSAKVTPVGRNLIEISGLNLIASAGKQLSIRYSKGTGYYQTDYGQDITIPIIISGKQLNTSLGDLNSLNSSTYQYLDLVVRDNATLTINSYTPINNTFQNVFIHPTGKIVVPEGRTFIVNSLCFWGGIDDIYEGSSYSNEKYEVPKLVLRGTLQNTQTAIDYIMRVDLEQMYSLALPYDVAFADMTYWDGEAMTPGTHLYVSTYNGQARANLDMRNTWLYETKFPGQKLTAGVGYTISAEPQADENSSLPMDSYALIRMPMKNNLTADGTEQAKTVAVTAYTNQNGVTISDNHKGWNLVGNPFMTDISSDMNGDQIVLGYLKETGTGPWEWVNDGVRYVTIPNDDGTYYWQEQFKKATLQPFKNFFVQIANTGELSFALAARQNAPARYLLNDMEQETEFEILLSDGNQFDHTGFLVSEQYSSAYEINADLEKMFGQMSLYSIFGGCSLAYNALSWTDAEQQISLGYRLPTIGEYTLSICEDALVDSVQHVYLTDHDANLVVDLLDGEYRFVSQVTENEGRFTIQIIRRSEIDDTTTDIKQIDVNNTCPQKQYYQGQIRILHRGNIYNILGQHIHQ